MRRVGRYGEIGLFVHVNKLFKASHKSNAEKYKTRR